MSPSCHHEGLRVLGFGEGKLGYFTVLSAPERLTGEKGAGFAVDGNNRGKEEGM